MSTVLVYDATGSNFSHLPAGNAAGYVTGSAGVAWSAEQFAEKPGAVRIDQSPAGTVWDATADVDDYESGAVKLSELAPRAKARLAAFSSGARPGQRRPAVYCSRANVTPVVNALIAAGITSGVGLWIADWNDDPAQAETEVSAASGPFPVIGRQYKNEGSYDISAFSAGWLGAVSAAPPAAVRPEVPPGQWDDPRAWTWRQATLIGVGLNGQLYTMIFSPATGKWVTP